MGKMKTTKWFSLLLAAGLCAGGLILIAPRVANAADRAGRLAERGNLLDKAKKKLKLTDDQVAQIKAVLKAEKETLTSELTRLHQSRTELRATIHDAGATETSVRAAAAKVAAAEADLAVERMKLYGKISPILTPEQLEKLKAFQARLEEAGDAVLDRINARLSE
jgi:Spy/CpxP family protein refolding chaperone